jgi:predicted nucleic acid-binding protein
MKPMNDSRVFLDSNVCLYLLSEDSPKKQKAEELLALPFTFISSQVLNENINVTLKKFKLSRERIFAHIDFLVVSCEVLGGSIGLQKKAIDLYFCFQLSFYDSLIVATALHGNCSILYSEDMQHELVIENKLTIVNPFV